MNEIVIRDDIFSENFELFRQKLRLYNKGEEFKSFYEGTPEKWEFYKRFVRIEGQERLDLKSWKREDIGNGNIIKKVIYAIEIDSLKNSVYKIELENNLLIWDLRNGEKGRDHKSLYDALENRGITRIYETLLFNFYFGLIDDKTAFNQFVELAGKKYSFIAYLFFLKNWKEYLPIAPETFDNAFKMLKISFKTSRRCSWDNYQTFISILRLIKEKIEIETGLPIIELIDAHSFCWMLVRIPVDEKIKILKSSSPKRRPLKIDHNKSVEFPEVIPKKGMVVSYEEYLKKYHRNLTIGRKAEIIVCNSERDRLKEAGRPNLAKDVTRVSDNPSLGYDIDSFEIDGTRIYIEVKAVRSFKDILSFYLSRNEWEKSQSIDNYYFYFVSFSKNESEEIEFIQGKELLSEYMMASEYFVKLPLPGK
jgi:hypothetical protein